MKTTIMYILIFTLAFAATTAGLFILNTKYNDVFSLDFSPPQEEIPDSVQAAIADSIASVPDSLTIMIALADSLENELSKLKLELGTAQTQLQQKDLEIENLKRSIETKKDSAYQAWLKSTRKLYETMESSKAAKLLSSISDNEARDLLYSMNKKKAAEILSNLSTEKIKKLTSPR